MLPETEAPQPWRIKPVLPVTKLLGAVAIVVLAAAFGRRDPVQWVLAVAVVLGLCGWALRDLVAPVRLAADHDGVTVISGFARRRRLAWAQVERIRMDRREHRGLRSETLEIDAGDSIYLYTVHDLGADPVAVLATLEALRDADDAQESSDSVR
jgi:hypothetical protein